MSKKIKNFSNEINKKIAALVGYTVQDVTINGESADASVKLVAPDVYHLITEIASEMQENNVDRLLEQLDKLLYYLSLCLLAYCRQIVLL